MEIIRADIIARWKKLTGFDVFFNTGTDEHGQKLFDSAKKHNMDVKDYVDMYAEKFKGLVPLLGISPDIHFIRTTDTHHEKAAQEFWMRVYNNGYIYKKTYTAKYCVGCEENKSESELTDGHCILHPNLEIEIRDEENYFFKLSAFEKKLLALYDDAEKEGRSFVVPNFRLNEMREFVRRGLEDFSISRLKEKMSWGVPVPNDSEHVMYVWFDALVNYISTLGWPENEAQFDAFWRHGTPVQYCGKDNTRFQSVMWQAMLMGAGLPPSHTIVVDGFITSGGEKMSKSLGNVVSPVEIVEEYGTEALRYHVAREFSTFEDSDFTLEKFKESYNANLANGLGNLVSRIMKMSQDNEVVTLIYKNNTIDNFSYLMERFEIKDAMDLIWQKIQNLDRRIAEEKPYQVVKNDLVEGKVIIQTLVQELFLIAKYIEPILPETSAKIIELIKANKSPETPLFARKD
jgi:methionyl-tRNA synthetase